MIILVILTASATPTITRVYAPSIANPCTNATMYVNAVTTVTAIPTAIEHLLIITVGAFSSLLLLISYLSSYQSAAGAIAPRMRHKPY